MPSGIQHKFSTKLALAFGFLVGLSVILTGISVARIYKRDFISQLTENRIAQAQLIASRLGISDLQKHPTPYIKSAIKKYSQSCGCEIMLARKDGSLVVQADAAGKLIEKGSRPGSTAEIQVALAGEIATDIRGASIGQPDILYVGVPISDGSQILGAIRMAVPLVEINRKVSAMIESVSIVGLLVVLLGILVGLLFSVSISRPMDEMAAVAHRLGQGDLSARVVDLPDDVRGTLGRTLNFLAERIEAMISEVGKEKSQLGAILENMDDGVVAVDANGDVLFLNSAFSHLFGVDPVGVKGKSFVEIFRNPNLDQIIGKTLETGRHHEREIEILMPEEGVFEVRAAPLIRGGEILGVIVVLHNITKVRNLEKVRKEFVANVSHELRTPLASIKGYAETLREGGMKDRRNRDDFVEIIERHANNMTNLVEDLLELSAIESGRRTPQLMPLSLPDMAREVVKNLSTLAEQKKIVIRIPDGGNIPVVQADSNQMKQVFSNLIQNAIKFNREEGTIDVSIETRPNWVKVLIRDSGIGIPHADLPRLFERFYRVEKARSREMGGTGLGLSIVKHIVEGHGGHVGVESQEGMGSAFWFELPI